MRIIYLALLLFVSLFLSGCNGGQQRDTQAGEKLLATLFTSNQDGRWDTFQAALENGDDVETAYLDYMATYQPFCTADGLDKVTSNRYSTQCDSLAQQNNVTIQPGEVAISGELEIASFRQTTAFSLSPSLSWMSAKNVKQSPTR